MQLPIPQAEAASLIEEFPETPGLYVHVPFCASICPFCPYNKVLYESDLVRDYFGALTDEIDMHLAHLGAPVPSLYIGGGTPTLCVDRLGPILARIPVTGERAIEVLPGHATPARLRGLRDIGINYVSLGAQSFDEKVLDHLGRPGSAAQNIRALDAAAGRFDCVDVDLMFDVAFQDERTFLRDVETCLAAGVEQISAYPVMRFGYTPFGKTRHEPAREHRALSRAEELASRYGYERRSVWTFNRHGSADYTSITREFFLGCGAGAATFSGRRFAVNHFSVAEYARRLAAGELPVARRTFMSERRAAAYYLFWRLYTGRIDVARFRRFFPGRTLAAGFVQTLRYAGLLRGSGDELFLTRRGYDRYHDLERWVTYRFIEPLWAELMQEHRDARADGIGRRDFSSRLWLGLADLARRA